MPPLAFPLLSVFTSATHVCRTGTTADLLKSGASGESELSGAKNGIPAACHSPHCALLSPVASDEPPLFLKHHVYMSCLHPGWLHSWASPTRRQPLEHTRAGTRALLYRTLPPRPRTLPSMQKLLHIDRL